MISPETQERQSTILTYAKLIIQNKMLEWASGNDPVFSELFTQYLA
ncbi:hypothetical protein KA037_02475 [Patescibacteria group bacterium]|nr:hypothetical protein [Patescibacteria group bacterium]